MKKTNYELKDIAKPENFFAKGVEYEEVEKLRDAIEEHIVLDEPVWCFPYKDESPFKIWCVCLEDDGRLLAKSKDSNAPEIMINYLEVNSMTLEQENGSYTTLQWDLSEAFPNRKEFLDYMEAYEQYMLDFDL